MVEIGGRRFAHVTDWTVEQDWWLMQRIRKAGLDQIVVDDANPDAIAESISQAAADKLADSGLALEILGGLLLPDGMDPSQWTPQLAAETTAHLGRQTGAEARHAVRAVASWAILSFFSNGLTSFVTSRPSSTMASGQPTADQNHAER